MLESPSRGDSNKYTKRMIYKKKCSKVSVFHALDGYISSFFITENFILQQIFGNNDIMRVLCIVIPLNKIVQIRGHNIGSYAELTTIIRNYHQLLPLI